MQPGSLVICINAERFSPLASVKMSALPQKNKMYTIRRIIPDFTGKAGGPGVALEEIWGQMDTFTASDGANVYEEYHFRMNRFAELLPPLEKEWAVEVVNEDELELA